MQLPLGEVVSSPYSSVNERDMIAATIAAKSTI